MSAFLGLVIFVLAYEAGRWLAIKMVKAARAGRALNREEQGRIHASASRWVQEKIDRHANMDEGYRRWRESQPWQQPTTPPAVCHVCKVPLEDPYQNELIQVCGRVCADLHLQDKWEQPDRIDARCIVCGETFPNIPPPGEGTLYCHTACFKQWKERM